MIGKKVSDDASESQKLNGRAGRPPGIASNCAEVQRFEAALRRLRQLDREIFLAISIDQMPAAEIARRTGLTIDEVEQRTARAIVTFDRALRDGPIPWRLQLRRVRWWPF